MAKATLPALGLGTFRLKGEPLMGSIHKALDLGYRHIDTAQMYENEETVGAALDAHDVPRDEVFLTTKIWHDQLHASDLINSLHDSLARLKTDHVDLALIHWPSPGDEVPMEEYLGALRAAQREGLDEHIGISNFTCAQMDEAKKILGDTPIFTNQVEVHPFLANRKVVEHAQKLGITVTGYRPLAVGKVMEDEILQRIARERNLTPAQVAIAWIASRGVVPIPSSTRPAHQKANLEALDVQLSEEEIRAIDALDRNERIANPDFAPAWD